MIPPRAVRAFSRCGPWPLWTWLGCVLLAAHSRADEFYTLTSPDSRLAISIQIPSPNSSQHPHWSLRFDGKPLLADCRLGLQLKGPGELLTGVRLLDHHSNAANRPVKVLFGKTAYAQDRYKELRIELAARDGRRLDVVFRCYDDAVALRYEMHALAKGESIVITDETTSFGLEGNPTAYAQYLENFTTSHEHNVTTVRASDLPAGQLLDMPLTLAWADGTCAAITEAALRHYAGMSLSRATNSAERPELVCELTPRADGTKVLGPAPLRTPWRVMLIGGRPGALLESSTLYCLNEPSVIGNTSWIKPGKITFSWWNGDVYDGHRDLPILSLAMA
ncbi:MAG TPA: glycoside hydrolase family 97 N-terminal domain-containing protein, partial [Verrucomicrobiae bacterium]|nr:glycoside hydrolase family 97 N-terminal domain-containing protein [Verrucomicrobiae bacterium]